MGRFSYVRVAISRLQDEADKTVADTGFADLFYGAGKDRRDSGCSPLIAACTLRVLSRIEVPIWPGMTTEHLMCGALIIMSISRSARQHVAVWS